MNPASKLDQLHYKARQNKWLGYFAIFCRIMLAAGFIPSGMQKILGERFTTLAVEHPMGHFLEAFYHTGFYYPFVGVMQVLAAILLLIPRTVTIGAFIYLPIILNICVLSLAVRFDGSQVTSPLMLCAVLFLLAWDYHKFRDIFPFHHGSAQTALPSKDEMTTTFPYAFFGGVLVVIVAVGLHATILYDIMPRNTMSDCLSQCEGENDPGCVQFCECIHKDGRSLRQCLDEMDDKE